MPGMHKEDWAAVKIPAIAKQVAFPDLINDFIQQPKEVPTPKFSLGSDTPICLGSYSISAPAGWESYRWNTRNDPKYNS
jgi:hypothetical protein